MSRLHVFLSPFLMLSFAMHAQSAKTLPTAVNVQRGRVLILSLLTQLESNYGNVGDDVQLRVARPLVADGAIILPAGSIIHGKMTKVRRASKNCTDGKIEWKYSPITLPGGKRLRLQSVDSNPEVYANPPPERIHLDNAGQKLRKGILHTTEYVGMASVVVVLSPLVIPMGVGMGGPGCKGETGKEESLSPGIPFYAAVSKDVQVIP